MKVALFVTCVNDGLYPNTPRAVVEVLERLGHDVVLPSQQTCCGQMHLNADTSLAMGRDKIARVRSTDAEVVCAVDNSCLTHLGGVASRSRLRLRTMHLAEILAQTGER